MTGGTSTSAGAVAARLWIISHSKSGVVRLRSMTHSDVKLLTTQPFRFNHTAILLLLWAQLKFKSHDNL